MSIRISWTTPEHTAALITFDGRWAWRDIDGMVAGLNALDSTAQHPYDLIVDGRNTTLWEPDLLGKMRADFTTPRLIHNRLTLIVGVDEFTRVLIEAIPALPGLGRLKFFFFDTPEAALVFSANYTETPTSE